MPAESSLDSALEQIGATNGNGRLCCAVEEAYDPNSDRESLFAEVMTQIEAAIIRELQNIEEEEPLDYEGDFDFENLEHDHHVVICPFCRYYRCALFMHHQIIYNDLVRSILFE